MKTFAHSVLKAVSVGTLAEEIKQKLRTWFASGMTVLMHDSSWQIDEQWQITLMERMHLLDYIPPIDAGDLARYRLTKKAERVYKQILLREQPV
ncbi:hypothetical protein HYZ97_04135 [Candidatus Pacearchaeota archaeon]|nr:hypothetical protein [Candidatus Pacearchaeota archaeon]